MEKWLLKAAVAAGLVFLACAAQADVLPAYNLTFSDYTGAAPKNYFSNVQPVGWTLGTTRGNLLFIDSSGPPGCAACADGPVYLSVYGPFPAPPVGGNYVEADGNPDFESVFFEEITGLTPGQTYTLSFYQAAGQQQGFTGDTTEQWIVSLGTQALTDSINGTNGSYSNPDPLADIKVTPLMSTPSGGVTPWQYVTLELTADAPTQLLSFLAWGDGGSTINLPPMVFLAGVNQPNVTPEPASLSLLGIGLLGLAASRMRRPARRTPTV
jgi:hypothetical protein